ncbi:MAG: LptF/LptG family permease [Natronospirillum sp.]
MKIAFKYVASDLIRYQLYVAMGFGLLLIGQQTINTLMRLPSIQPLELGQMLLFMQANIIGDVLPIALSLSILLSNGQLYNNNEIFALYNAGLSRNDIFKPALFTSIAVGILLTFNLTAVKPRAEIAFAETLHKVFTSHFTVYISEKIFYALPNSDFVVWTDKNQNGTLYNAFFFDEKNQTAYTAKQAALTEELPGTFYFSLFEGEILILNDSNKNIEHTRFEQLDQLLISEDFYVSGGRRFRYTTDLLTDNGSSARSELMWRITQLPYCLTLFLLMTSLSPRSTRTTPAIGIFLGITAFFVFNSLANHIRGLANNGVINPSFSLITYYTATSLAIIFINVLRNKINAKHH